MIGRFEDDYGNHYRIAAMIWVQEPRSRYHLVEWNPTAQFVLARNDAENPSAGGRWTRIDWVTLPGMPPYDWGFCLTVYAEPDLAAARAAPSANRNAPRTGCGGHPFSRMKRTR